MSQDRQSATENNRAELVWVGDEQVVVEQCHDSIEHDNRRTRNTARNAMYRKGWVADWSGCEGIKGFGVSGDSREEVVWLMEEKITSKKFLRKMQELCRYRRE